jgi:hypothetical protein
MLFILAISTAVLFAVAVICASLVWREDVERFLRAVERNQ